MGYILPKGSSRADWVERGKKTLPKFQMPKPVQVPPPPQPAPNNTKQA